MEEELEIQLREGAKRRKRPCSASFVAVRAALYQLTRLNDFRAEKIGGGFYADVFKVTHKSTGEVMVLKMNKNRKYSKQMLSEIQLMNRLSHSNILKFKGSCVHEGQLHALTEYINGGSLEDLLHDRSIDLSWSVRVRIALDIARGMAYLHSRGVFHRDLSSRNCLIQRLPDGTTKTVVADFGLAAKIKQARHRSHTEVVGSPYWMAPECLNGKQYCEQADVFSYGIVLAEIMARIPADPDFMPRTRLYGMDFEALRKMCLGCPEDLWDLMVRCCQIDPDARCTFDEAVQILEQVVVPEEVEESERDDDLRACFSEPLLTLQDSDDNMSFTSGQSSNLPPVNSLESVESYSEGQNSNGRLQAGSNPTPDTQSGAQDSYPHDQETENNRQSSTECQSEKPSVNVSMGSSLLPQLTTMKTALESDDEGTNKGDSGIDPGELFVCPPTTSSEAMASHEGVSPGTTPKESGFTLTKGEDREVQISHSCAEREEESGDNTPLCPSPTPTDPNRTQNHNYFRWGPPLQQLSSQRVSGSPAPRGAIPMYRTPSSDTVPPTTPNDCCCSPHAPSSASEISFYLPRPSTPWAPPPSPVRSSFYRLSSSLPSSPTQKLKQFQWEVQEVAFPPFDPSSFISPAGTVPVKMRSKHRCGLNHPHCRHSLRHSYGTNIALPPFPEDLELESGESKELWSRDSSLCMNLEQEKFSHLGTPRRRTRSSSNPVAPPVPLQPVDYSLTLARYSPENMHNNASSFKCYNIKTRQNYRLSSSEPNLTSLVSTQLL